MCLPTLTDVLDINLAIEQQKIRASLVGHRTGSLLTCLNYSTLLPHCLFISLVINRYFI